MHSSIDGRELAAAGAYDFNLKNPFEVEPARLIPTILLIIIFGSLGAAAGIGGGGLFIPVYGFLFGAGTKGAVPLSKGNCMGFRRIWSFMYCRWIFS